MIDTEISIQRNKKIIKIFIILVSLSLAIWVISNSTYNATIYFHYVHNRNTGEAIGLAGSLIMYIGLWILSGVLLSSILMGLSMFSYVILHRKDEKILKRYYHPVYEEELTYGIDVSRKIGYVLPLVFIILHVSNIVTINYF